MELIIFVAIFLAGFGCGFLAHFFSVKLSKNSIQQYIDSLKEQRHQDQTAFQTSFSSINQVFHSQIQALNQKFDRFGELVQTFEKERSYKIGQISEHMQFSKAQLSDLVKLTSNLNQVLGHGQVRGSFGEKLTEDLLRAFGLVENIHYVKQQTTTIESKNRPDFIIKLPNNKVLTIDVKFPFDQYKKIFSDPLGGKIEENARRDFMTGVRRHIREVSARGYGSDPDQGLDFSVLLVPNEQVYTFVNQESPDIFEYAISAKVLLCSPQTFFPVLYLVRHICESYQIVESSREIFSQIHQFRGQWDKFVEKLGGISQKIVLLQKDFDALMTTRKVQMERSMSKITALDKKAEKLKANDDTPESLILMDSSSPEMSVD